MWAHLPAAAAVCPSVLLAIGQLGRGLVGRDMAALCRGVGDFQRGAARGGFAANDTEHRRVWRWDVLGTASGRPRLKTPLLPIGPARTGRFSPARARAKVERKVM